MKKYDPNIEVEAHLANGQKVDMPLSRAVEMDKPEGVLTVKISATLFLELINKINSLSNEPSRLSP